MGLAMTVARRTSGRAWNEVADTVIDNLGHGVLILDYDGVVRRANRASREMFNLTGAYEGRRLLEVAGRTWRRTGIAELLAKARAGGAVTADYSFGPGGGKLNGKVVRCTAQALAAGGQPQGVLLTTQFVADDARTKLLLEELNHRIRNSLHLVSTFVAAQQRQAGQGGDGYAAIRARIGAIATLYDVMSAAGRSDAVRADVFIEALADGLRRSLLGEESRITLQVHVEPVLLSAEQATPVGLIVNELVTNSVKHAFPDRGGEIVLRLTQEADGLALEVTDNGVGLSCDAAKGSGSRYVTAFTAQLKAVMTLTSGAEGTTFKFTLPPQPRAAIRSLRPRGVRLAAASPWAAFLESDGCVADAPAIDLPPPAAPRTANGESFRGAPLRAWSPW
jgi:two-component sensor histidine kinase